MDNTNDRRGSGRIAAFALAGFTALSVGCVAPPQVLDTHTGDWETVPLPGFEVAPPEPQDQSSPLYNEPAGPPEPGKTAVETLESVGGGN